MKTMQVLKAILFGAVAGAAIFFIPFPFRFFFGFFLIFFVIRFFVWGRGSRNRDYNGYHHFWNPSYTQRWRSMGEEERKAFIKKMESELFKVNLTAE